MAQLFFLALTAIIIYYLAGIVKKIFSYKYKTPGGVKPDGDIIDISEAWIDLSHLPYSLKPHILTDQELNLFKLINDVINKQTTVVIPKAHLSEILDLTPSASHRTEYARRLRERYVDFLICRREDMAPLLLILTEGRNEGVNNRQNHDFVKQAAQTAGLAILTLGLYPLPDKRSLATLLGNAGVPAIVD